VFKSCLLHDVYGYATLILNGWAKFNFFTAQQQQQQKIVYY